MTSTYFRVKGQGHGYSMPSAGPSLTLSVLSFCWFHSFKKKRKLNSSSI